MICFVAFVPFCSRLLGTGRYKLGDPVNEIDRMETVLKTEGHEGNEEASNSISACGESVFRCAIGRRECPLQTRFCPLGIKL
jgi:hypothetical protein